MKIKKIEVSDSIQIRKLLELKLARINSQDKYLPDYSSLDLNTYVKKIVSSDGVIVINNEIAGFICFSYKGIMFNKRSGLYIPEWAHCFTDNWQLNYALLSETYKYMKKHNIVDHSISIFESRHDLKDFFFDCNYGSRCIDAHTLVKEASIKDKDIRLASMNDKNDLIRLLKEHHKYLVDSPVLIGFTFDKEEEEVEDMINNREVYVIDDNGVKGFMKLTIGRSDGCDLSTDKQTLGIQTTHIGQAFRGQGYGSRLVNFAHAFAKENKMDKIAVDYESMNYEAHKFWSKHFNITIRSLVRTI